MREIPSLGREQEFPGGSAISGVLALCQAWCYMLDFQYFIEVSQQSCKVNIILLCRLRNRGSERLYKLLKFTKFIHLKSQNSSLGQTDDKICGLCSPL